MTRILSESETLRAAAPRILEALGLNLDWEVGNFWVVEREARLISCVETWQRRGSTRTSSGG